MSPSQINAGALLQTVQLVACAVRTATVTGSGVDILNYDGPIKVTQYSEQASAGDTLDGKLQDSPDGSTGWGDVTGATFTQVGDAGGAKFETIQIDPNKVKRFIRYVGTVAGGTPSWAFGAFFNGFLKYQG